MAKSKYTALNEIMHNRWSKESIDNTFAQYVLVGCLRSMFRDSFIGDVAVTEDGAHDILEVLGRAKPIRHGYSLLVLEGSKLYGIILIQRALDEVKAQIQAQIDSHAESIDIESLRDSKLTVGCVDCKHYSDDVWQVDTGAMAPDHQGMGIMTAAYAALVRDHGYTLVSGDTQSQGARRMWGDLAEQPGVFVYGWDDKHHRAFHVFDGKDGQLDGAEQDVYPDQDEKDHLNQQIDDAVYRQREACSKIPADADPSYPGYEECRRAIRAAQELEDIQNELLVRRQHTSFNILLVAIPKKGTRIARDE